MNILIIELFQTKQPKMISSNVNKNGTGMTINVIQENVGESKYEYSDGTKFTVDVSEKNNFKLLGGNHKQVFDIFDGVVRLYKSDPVPRNTRIVCNKRKVYEKHSDKENTIRTISIMDYVFHACVNVFYSVVLIYGPTQSGKTKTAIQTCIDTMNKEDCPTLFITRNYTDEAEQQFKNARAKIHSHGLDVVFLRNDNDYKELARCMIEGDKTIFIGLGNNTTLTKIAKYAHESSREDTYEFGKDTTHVKYIMAVDEVDIYVNKKEESKTSALLKDLLDGSIRKLFISATLLDVTTLITETDYVDKIPTKFAFGDFCLGDKEYYRSFESFNKYFIDTKDPVQCLKDVMIESNAKSYHRRGLPYITAMFHSQTNAVNENNALKLSKMDFEIYDDKTVKMSMITSDQTGTKLYTKGKMCRKFDDIQDALTYVRVSKHKYVNILCGKMFSRAFNVTCTEHLCYISVLIYLMRDTDASLMVQRIGRMCGVSKLKNKCPQYLYAPEKVIHKCIDTVKINQCMIAQTDKSVPFLDSIPNMMIPERKTHGNVKLSMTRIEKKLKTDTEAAEALLEDLAPLKSTSMTKIKKRVDKRADNNDPDYEPTKGTKLQILRDKIIKYVNDNDNRYRSHSEWFEITGLCSYKSRTVHHHTMMTYLVRNNFLERNNDNKLRLNINS